MVSVLLASFLLKAPSPKNLKKWREPLTFNQRVELRRTSPGFKFFKKR